jgi:hypothetical protein
LETFIEIKRLVENTCYAKQRRQTLSKLNQEMIDPPLIGLVEGLNKLPHCFTLQCCHGHFVYSGQTDPENLMRLPVGGVVGPVHYRIAYLR